MDESEELITSLVGHSFLNRKKTKLKPKHKALCEGIPYTLSFLSLQYYLLGSRRRQALSLDVRDTGLSKMNKHYTSWSFSLFTERKKKGVFTVLSTAEKVKQD